MDNVINSLHNSLQELNESVAFRGEPVRSLAECLNKQTRDGLLDLAKAFEIQKYSKLKKSELVEQLSEILINPTLLRGILMEANEEEFILFADAAKHGAISFGSASQVDFHSMHYLGIIAAFQREGVITVIIPDEILGLWNELEKDGFSAEKLRGEMLHKYASAAVNLYGAVRLETLIHLISRLEGVEVDFNTLAAALLAHKNRSEPYFLWEEYAVHALFGDDDESIGRLLELASDIPRYVPDRDVFLEYATSVYYERTPQNNAVAGFLKGIVGDRTLAGILTGNVRLMFAASLSEDDCRRMLENGGIKLNAEKSMQAVTTLLTNMRLETRLWEKRGHTFSEAEALEELGRNDKCPCESGLKFKKCCAGK